VRSTEEPVGTEEEHQDRGTEAQPRVSCGAPKHRQRIGPKERTKEHLRGQGMGPKTGAEEENRGEAREPSRRTELMPKVSCRAPRRRRGAEEEHRGEAEEPRTTEAEEGTEHEHRRGRRTGPSRSTAEAKEGTEQEHR
jgi:hypothetical protein